MSLRTHTQAPTTVQLLGLPSDVNSSFLRGPALAPALIRQALGSNSSNAAAEDGRELGVQLRLHDRGDISMSDTPHDHERIRAAAHAAAQHGPVLCLGGDHSIAYPVVEALAAQHGALNILHFDAHPDLYDNFEGNPHSHASPFARIMERGLAKRLVQVGIRTQNTHCAAQARRFGVEVVPWLDFSAHHVPIPEGPLYVSIDLDALDPAFAPGVSHFEPGGLSVRDVLTVLHRIKTPPVGADVVEYNPKHDHHDMTAFVAAKFVKELVACMTPRA